jgi:hypothetical protein
MDSWAPQKVYKYGLSQSKTAETVVMNSKSQMVGGLNRLLPKEIR